MLKAEYKVLNAEYNMLNAEYNVVKAEYNPDSIKFPFYNVCREVINIIRGPP